MTAIRWLVATFATVFVLAGSQQAHAGSQTFIQVLQVNPSDKPWVFTNDNVHPATFKVGNILTGAGAAKVLLSVSTLVNGMATPTVLLANETAFLTAAAGASANASSFEQSFLSGEIKYTDVLTGKLILDVHVHTSSLKGQAKSGALSGSVAPNVVTFSSVLFPLINTLHEQNYAISLSGIAPAPTSTSNGYLRSFRASGAGSFAGAPVPEPATIALALSGLPVLGIVHLRRRAKRA